MKNLTGENVFACKLGALENMKGFLKVGRFSYANRRKTEHNYRKQKLLLGSRVEGKFKNCRGFEGAE